MLRAIRVAFFFAVLCFAAPSVFGCSCDTPSQSNAFRKARIVFLGKVIQVKVTPTHTDKTLDYPYAVTFQVERSWKGVRSDTITILAHAPFLPCEGFSFHEGDRYLVYAYGNDLLVEVSCTQTKLADSATNDIRKLNRYRNVTISGAQSNDKASTWNKGLEAELNQMGVDDQKYRGVIEAEAIKMSATGTANASDEFVAAVKSQDEIDARNIARLEEIIMQHGWPGKSLVGEEASKAAFLILQHSNLTRQQKYLPLLKKAAKKGDARLADVAMLEDRVLVSSGKKQVYGTQVRSGPDTGGKLILAPIEDEQHVDKRRASVGLMPLKEYLRYFGIEYIPPGGK